MTAVVAEATLAKSATKFPTLELDVVAVKGRKRSTRVYTFLELLGSPDRLQPLQRATASSSPPIAIEAGTKPSACSMNAATWGLRG